MKCKPYEIYMKVNSNDQLDLKGSCLSQCDGKSLAYNYELSSWNTVLNQWILFAPNNSYYYTTGKTNSNLVITKKLFEDFSSQIIWKVDLNLDVKTYDDERLTSTTSLLFYVNFSPKNGTCNLNSKNATTNEIFLFSCMNWIDPDGSVASYAYYGK